MAAVTNGAELVQKLKASGTPDQRLAPARAVLSRIKRDRGEIANSDEVIDALDEAYGEFHGTVIKARQIAETGTWTPPKKEMPVVAVEDELLAEDGVAVSTAAPVRAAPKAGKRPRVRKAIETKQSQEAEAVV